MAHTDEISNYYTLFRKPSLVYVSTTFVWLRILIYDSEIDMEGYKCYRVDSAKIYVQRGY